MKRRLRRLEGKGAQPWEQAQKHVRALWGLAWPSSLSGKLPPGGEPWAVKTVSPGSPHGQNHLCAS